ncbi:MAG: NAD-dependent epimerase/dehydratase family protein [Eubacteriales bacterium]|nr:NAD-dependent epimerase/dehydratase family protein [Eubacteriales bacterium]
MIRILVTGINSYIGNSFMEYMRRFPEEYELQGISCRDGSWKDRDFSGFDCIFHVAGIAHADSGKITEERKARYYAVNRDLTVELAQKAKKEGVRQFIFMSSAIVYGDSAPIGKKKLITDKTEPSPSGAYGDSKLQAEKGILALGDADFRVVVLRPPMIYGKNSKGNYPILSSLAKKLPFFPDVDNQRSMLYVGNLVEFVRLMIKNNESGIFWPQNAEYSNTSDLVRLIAAEHGKKIPLVGGLSGALKLVSLATPLVNKAFGSLSYDMNISEYKEPYRLYSLEESIKLTENQE